MSERTVICLTPVKNEAWILETFLAAASLWADHIVVADQGSSDGSREIAAAHPKVMLVDNPSPEFDEHTRQSLLVRAARELTDTQRVLIALDADEALAASTFAGAEWARALEAAPGTAFRWRWANVLPDGERVWVPAERLYFGVVDDGRRHSGARIHGVRVPVDPDGRRIDFDQSVVLHLQYLDWQRMKSKQAWYQCWETLENGAKRPAALYRQYHHMDAVPSASIRPLDRDWVAGYRRAGLDLTGAPRVGEAWWDREILDWMDEFGPRRFAKLDLWNVDWSARARELDHPIAEATDPRTALDRAVGRWLCLTQRRARSTPIRILDLALRLFGW